MGLTIHDDFLFAVNANLVPGHRLVHKFGRNNAAGTSKEDIMFGGGLLAPLTAPATMEAASASANDTAAGTHTRTIEIFGVNGNFDEISEIITMNGLSSSSPTTQKFLRVYRARVLTQGTFNTANDGNITVRIQGAGNTQLIIEAGTSVSQTSHYTIPMGCTGFLLSVGMEVDSSKTSRIVFTKRENDSLLVAPFCPHEHVHTWDGVAGAIDEMFAANHVFNEKTDVWAESVAGAIATPLEFDYDLLVIDNKVLNG